MNKIFDKYIFPVLTVINTIQFVTTVIALTTPAATPMTAFLAVVFGAVTLGSWSAIFYSYQLKKFYSQKKVSVVEFPNKTKAE